MQEPSKERTTWGTSDPPRLPWTRVSAELVKRWAPGDHFSIIAPTDYGKSYFALRGLVPLRSHVIMLDPKGDDDTLDRFGGRRITTAPTRVDLWRWAHEDGTYRLRLNPKLSSARGEFDKAIRLAWSTSRKILKATGDGVTFYVDETRILSDKLGMRDHLETLWIGARSRGITLIASTQAPRYVPGEFYDQAKLVAIGNVRDRRALRRLAEIGGDTDMLMDVVPRLRWHEFLIVGPEWAVRTTMPARMPRERSAPERQAAPLELVKPKPGKPTIPGMF